MGKGIISLPLREIQEGLGSTVALPFLTLSELPGPLKLVPVGSPSFIHTMWVNKVGSLYYILLGLDKYHTVTFLKLRAICWVISMMDSALGSLYLPKLLPKTSLYLCYCYAFLEMESRASEYVEWAQSWDSTTLQSSFATLRICVRGVPLLIGWLWVPYGSFTPALLKLCRRRCC
jgi:hypothetical protein